MLSLLLFFLFSIIHQKNELSHHFIYCLFPRFNECRQPKRYNLWKAFQIGVNHAYALMGTLFYRFYDYPFIFYENEIWIINNNSYSESDPKTRSLLENLVVQYLKIKKIKLWKLSEDFRFVKNLIVQNLSSSVFH